MNARLGKILWCFGLAAVLAVGVPPSAHATKMFDFEFTSGGVVTVGPTDIVSMNAVLTNLSDAGEHILGGDVSSASFTGFAFNPYDFSFGPSGNFFAQFTGMDLAPLETFAFVFGTLTPKSPPVALGTYAFPDNFMTIGFGAEEIRSSSRTFTVIVASSAVPEPGTLVLLATGLAALPFIRRLWS